METSLLFVCEVSSPNNSAPSGSHEAFFTLVSGQTVHVAQKVYLRTIHNGVLPNLPSMRLCRPIRDVGIEGPVVGAWKRTVGVEFVVRNDVEGSPIHFAYLRDPRASEVPEGPEFVEGILTGLANAVYRGCMVWCMGVRTPTFLHIVPSETREGESARRPRIARAHEGGLGATEASPRTATRRHMPLKPSPLAQDAMLAMKE